MTLTSILLVAAGGAIGSVMRYMVSVAVAGRYTLASFPLGTLVVNLFGSFCIGILLAYLTRNGIGEPSAVKVFFGAGVLGGFTTFSTFSAESLAMFQRGDVTGLITYAVLSFCGGLLLCYFGFRISS